MEDFAQVYLASPPSSLPDGLLAPHESGTPIPRPRRSSSLTLTSPTLSLTSTPKHPVIVNHRHLPPTPITNGHDHHRPPGRGVLSNGSMMQRAPSLDSATYRITPISPIAHLMTNNHSDSETEEDNSSPLSVRRGSNSRPGNHSGRSVRRAKHQQNSYSLPVTPRANGGSPFAHTINGIQPLTTSYTALANSPALLGYPYGSSSHVGLGLDYSHQDTLSPGVSQYITCHNISEGRSDGTLENSMFLRNYSKLPGAIDYSSLPLPEENNGGSNGSGRNRRDKMSRHLSEPCIPQSGRKSQNRKSRNRNSKEVLSREREMGNINESLNGKENSLESDGALVGGELNTLEVQWRFIQTLVTELNNTKSSNRKLMTELHQAKMEIQALRTSLDSYTESGIQPGAITEMVGAIHAAQKVRDESMMARIKLANEERDSALTHTRALMEKLSINPYIAADHKPLAGDSLEQDIPGGSSSMTDSPRRSVDRRHKRSQDPTHSSPASTTSYTGSSNSQGMGLGEQHQQRGPQQSPAESEGTTVAYLAGLEEELKALRLATAVHTPGGITGGLGRVSAEYMESLCSQLKESEVSRWQLQDQCTRLERLVNVLRKKVNGLSVTEQKPDGTKLTFVDFTLHGPDFHNQQGTEQSTGQQQQVGTSTSSEGEPKDSLSSLDSNDTTSASSWKRGDPLPSSTNLSHADALRDLTPITVTYSGTQQPKLVTQHSLKKNSPVHSTPFSPRNQKNSAHASERDARNIPGVTIVGPITEL